MNGYIAHYGSKRAEIYAESLREAADKAVDQLKVPRSKRGLLSVMIAEKNGVQVVHSTAGL